MTIHKRPFPDRFAILPSDGYAFGSTNSPQGFQVVAQTLLPNDVSVLAINKGLLAFDFAGNSALGGFEILNFDASGLIPKAVTENREKAIEIQSERIKLATFVTACIYGVHAFETHSSVKDALFPSLDEIYSWVATSNRSFGILAEDTHRLATRLLRRPENPSYIPEGHVTKGLELASRLIQASASYQSADPVSMIVMTYQAMILHSRQHAGASIALQAVVAEAAVGELLFAFGLVNSVPARLPNINLIALSPISKKCARNLGFNGTIDLLAKVRVLDSFLVERVNELRRARNDLMHDAQDSAPKQSGNGLTALRDLLRLCTGENEFELNMSWSYRL